MKNTFTGKTRLFLTISGAIIAIALVMQIVGVGLNLGIDFTGGSLLNYSVGEDYDIKDVETILASMGYEGSQVTKAAPSDASIALQEERAEAVEEDEEDADVEETEDIEETEDVEEEAAPADLLIDLDKSGIAADGLTDLQLRLNLVDEAEGLEQAIAEAVKAVLPGAEEQSYASLTNALIVKKNFDASFSGGYMAEFSVGAEFDSAEVADAVRAALAEN